MTTYGYAKHQSGHILEDDGPSYPLLQWYNYQANAAGVGGVQEFGGFVFKVDQPGGDEFPIGEIITYTYRNGDTAAVHDIGAARIAIVARRLDWFLGDKGDPDWVAQYEKGAKGRNRWLVYLPDAHDWHERHGLVMVSLYGVNGVILSKLIREFRQKLHRKAEQAAGQKLDGYTFAMPLVPSAPELASQQYATKITPPQFDGCVLVAYEGAPQALLDSLYIGDAGMALCASHWDDAQKWTEGSAAGSYTEDNGQPSNGQEDDAPQTNDVPLVTTIRADSEPPPHSETGWPPPSGASVTLEDIPW